MDNLAYLNQISQTTRPTTPQKSSGIASIFTPKVIKLLIAAVAAFILIIVCSSLLSNMNAKPLELTKQLELRMENLSTTLSDYKNYLKSPSIISANSSLNTLLTNDITQLTAYLSENHGYDTSSPDASLSTDETSANEELVATLEDARLNGYLDGTYVREISLQITYLLSTESEILERTDEETLKSIIQSSYDSLTSIETTFDKLNAAE